MNELYTLLPLEIREELSRYEERAVIPAGAKLLSQGAAVEHLIIIEQGSAGVSVAAEEYTIALGFAGKGRVLGLRSILSGALAEIDAAALEPCIISRISKRDFKTALQRYPAMYFAIAKLLSLDLNAAERCLREAPRVFTRKRNAFARPRTSSGA